MQQSQKYYRKLLDHTSQNEKGTHLYCHEDVADLNILEMLTKPVLDRHSRKACTQSKKALWVLQLVGNKGFQNRTYCSDNDKVIID